MIIRHEPKPDAELKLFCFPYAGGTAAAYRPWNAFLPPQVELNAVELPGRPVTKSAPFTDIEALLQSIYPMIVEELDRDFVVYGHSFGSIIAFELCRMLEKNKQKMPQKLIVSSRRAPHLANSNPATDQLSDDEFIHVLQRQYNAIPQAVLDTPELLQMLLPMLRADITINEQYQATLEPKLNIPVWLLYGEEDKTVDKAPMLQWQEVTLCDFVTTPFPGGHFFFNDQLETFIKTLFS